MKNLLLSIIVFSSFYFIGGKELYAQKNKITTTNLTHHLSIFPNPVVKGILTLDFGEAKNQYQYKVYNMVGAVLEAGVLDANLKTKHKLNVTDLPTGSYFITLFNAEEKITKRITVRN